MTMKHSDVRPHLLGLHGWGMTPRAWQPLTDRLSPNIRMDVPDLPGHVEGRSRLPATLSDAVAMIAADVARPVTLLGWSLGALIALAWVLERPADIDRLILLCASPCFVRREGWECAVSPGDFAGFEHGIRDDVEATLKRFCALQAAGDAQGRILARVLTGMTSSAGASDLAWGLGLLKTSDLRLRLGEIQVPVLVIQGAKDALIPTEAAEFLVSRIPRAELRLVEGASHAPHVSRPEIVAGAISGFLDG